MKISEILEGKVVSIFPKLAAKQEQKISNDVRKQRAEREQFYKDLKKAMEDVNELGHYADNVKDSPGVPGFNTLEDIFYYLGNLFYRQSMQTKTPIEWFHRQPVDTQSKLRMIAYHTDRIRKTLDGLRQQIKNFNNKWQSLMTTEISQEEILNSPIGKMVDQLIGNHTTITMEVQAELELLNRVVNLIQRV